MSRTLHLVDIENLCADPDAPAAIVRDVLDDYLATAMWQECDLVVIASNPVLARRFVWDRPVDWSVHTAHGDDGADLALLTHAAPEFVARRADRLVIGSGDHAFIPRALECRRRGVGVLVVARLECTARGWHEHGFPVQCLGSPLKAAA